MDDFKVWYFQQPFVTRTFLTGCVAISIMVSFQFLNPASISLDYELVLYKFQIIGMLFSAPFMTQALILYLIYIWAKRRPQEIVQFFFGIRVKSAYFPFVLAGFYLLEGQNIFVEVAGIVIGHVYIYLKDILPIAQRKDYLRTPQFFTRFVNKYILQFAEHQTVLGHNQRQQQQQQPQPQQFRPFAGRGVRIG